MSERVEYVVLCVDGALACLPIGSGGRQDAIELCALRDHPENLKHGPHCGPHRVVKRTITEEVIHADR